MNTSTGISTAARRITQAVNAGTHGLDELFTIDGENVGSIPNGQWFAEGVGPDYQIRVTVDTITQRQAQDLVDAATAHPADRDAQLDYLMRLEIAREAA